MTRDILQGEERWCYLCRIHFHTPREREEEPSGPIQRRVSNISVASGDMAEYQMCLKLWITQDPFSPSHSCLPRFPI